MIESTLQHIEQQVINTTQRIVQLEKEIVEKTQAITLLHQTVRVAKDEMRWYEKVLAFARREKV